MSTAPAQPQDLLLHPQALSVGIAQACECFEQWASTRTKNGDFEPKTAYTYRTLWHAWLLWLCTATPNQQALHWLAITPQTLQKFLSGPAPGNAISRRRPIRSGAMSNYTQQRYWRVLRAVYAQATKDGLCPSNPALDMPETERPHIQRRSRQSQILPPGILECLQAPNTIALIHPIDSGELTPRDWPQLRNQAVLALLAHLGLTTREIANLCAKDVRLNEHPALEHFRSQRALQMDWLPALSKTQDTLQLDIATSQDNLLLSRTLTVPAPAAAFLCRWLATRERLLLSKLATLSPPALIHQCSLHAPLFFSRQRRSTSATSSASGHNSPPACPLPPMDESSIYVVIKRSMLTLSKMPQGQALQMGPNAAQNAAYIAKGAAIVRNSLIRHWLDTQGVEQTIALAGLKNAQSLRLIPPSQEIHTHD